MPRWSSPSTRTGLHGVVEPEPPPAAPEDTREGRTAHTDRGRGGSSGVRVEWLALPVVAVFASLASRPVGDNSALSHLAVGRLQLSSGLPQSNPFLYSSSEFPVPSWWWSWTLAATEWLAGANGLRLLGLVLGAAFGVALVRLVLSGIVGPELRGRGASMPDGVTLVTVAVPCAFFAVVVMRFLNLRPHLVGFLLLAAALLVMIERRSPWWMLAIFCAWVNMHGSWLYGFVVVAAIAGAMAVDDRRFERGDLLRLGSAAGGAVLGAVAHPDRMLPLYLPWRQMGDPLEREALRSYDEWAALGVADPRAWALVALGLIAAVGAARRRRAATLVLCVGLVVLGLGSSRVAPLAGLALVPLAAPALLGVGSVSLPSGRAARAVASVSGAVLVVATVAALTGPAYRLDRYPVAAVDWLEERDLATEPARVATHDYIGNYLSWRYGADANTFVDDRPAAATLIAYRQILRQEDGWREALADAAPDVVVWASGSPLTRALSDDPRWFEAVELDDFTVLCRSALAERCR